MTDSSTSKNAQEWAEFLCEKALPSPFKVGEFVVRKLSSETLSYPQLTDIINHDPILSFKILTRANKETKNSTLGKYENSKTLAHAISLLGIDGLKESINHLPKKAISPKNISSFYYLKTLSTSIYAAYLARAVSLRKKKGSPEEIYWSALFLNAPTWYLWRFATAEMRLVDFATRSNFKHAEAAEKEILGEPLKKITRAISKELLFPQVAQECYEKENQLSSSDWVSIARSTENHKYIRPIDNRALKIKLQKPHFIVMLANLLAQYSSECWYSRATLRMQRVLSYYLNCPLEEAVTFTHEIAAEMSRNHPLPGLMLPAARLFVPPINKTKVSTQKTLDDFQDQNFDTTKLLGDATKGPNTETLKQKLNNEDTFSSSSNKPTTSTLEDTRSSQSVKSIISRMKMAKNMTDQKHALFEELTSLMINKPESFANFNELMNAATQGIGYGINLKRSFVALVNKDNSRFRSYYTVGCTGMDQLKNLESPVTKGSIFQKLCERPASIWLKPNSEQKIKDLIPADFKMAVDVNEFFLMSVFAGKKPIAIFYADNMDNQTLNEQNYQQFKLLCGAVSSALQHQAKINKSSTA